MMLFRFLQGIGTGGEVPVASAYINEFIGAKKRGRFFLLYELIFPIGLLFAGIAAYFLVPSFGWKALFIVGIIPALIDDPAAGPDARIPPLARLQGPDRQGRQDRLHAGERSGQGRQTAARTGDPPGRPQGHRRSRTGGSCSRASTSSAP